MDELLKWMDYIEDNRQQTKVRHKLKDIIVIVLFAMLANVDDWVEMEYFAHYHEAYLKKYIELRNGIPSHDTFCRVFGMLSSEILQKLYGKWQELLNQNEGEALRKLICIDGKTMRSNKRKEGKTNHIITAWNEEDRFSLGQKVVNTKSNEITAIPELLEKIRIKGQVVTIDIHAYVVGISNKIFSLKECCDIIKYKIIPIKGVTMVRVLAATSKRKLTVYMKRALALLVSVCLFIWAVSSMLFRFDG